jgi:hypothetical protein
MRHTGWERTSASAGIAFAVLITAGSVLMLADFPDDSDRDILAFYDDTGAHVRAIIGYLCWAVASIFLLAFLIRLRDLLGEAEGGAQVFSRLAYAGGSTFVAVVLVSGAAVVAVAGAIELGGLPAPDPDWMRILPQFGFGLLRLGGGLSALLWIYASAVVIRRTAVLPRWTARAGWACGVIQLVLFTPAPMVAIPVWVALVSVAMLRREPVVAVGATSAAPAEAL